MTTRHGEQVEEIPIEALLSDDPEIYLVNASMAAYHESHPCECEALCVCDRGGSN